MRAAGSQLVTGSLRWLQGHTGSIGSKSSLWRRPAFRATCMLAMACLCVTDACAAGCLATALACMGAAAANAAISAPAEGTPAGTATCEDGSHSLALVLCQALDGLCCTQCTTCSWNAPCRLKAHGVVGFHMLRVPASGGPAPWQPQMILLDNTSHLSWLLLMLQAQTYIFTCYALRLLASFWQLTLRGTDALCMCWRRKVCIAPCPNASLETLSSFEYSGTYQPPHHHILHDLQSIEWLSK